jgi:hypothetical protein
MRRVVLIGLLALAVLGALLGRALEQKTVTEAELATARDEAAELRRKLFTTQDQLAKSEQERRRQAAIASGLERVVAARGAEHEAVEELLGRLRAEHADGGISPRSRP